MRIAQAIAKIRQAGFTIEAEAGRIAIEPLSRLSDSQLRWLKSHKAEILAELRSERVVVHVPEFQLQTGQRVSFDMTVPKVHLPALRQSLRFVLKDDQGGGSVIGEPGKTRDELMDILRKKYGDRLATIG